MQTVLPSKTNLNQFLEHFHLEKDPFSDSLNLDFYFKTERNEQSLYKMMMCVEHNISLGLVTADSGLGKSLLGQKLLVSLSEMKYQTALVLVTPEMSRTNFLKELCFELTGDESVFDIRDSHTVLKHLQNEVIELYERGKKSVIIIDEAHFLSAKSLHTLRTLSNIEVPEKKLITCILLAENGFLKRIKHSSYKSLDSRMYIRESLLLLTRAEVEQYIKFRITAGGGDVDMVDAAAYDVIHEKSGGVCRKINKIMTLSLMQAFFTSQKRITSDMIREIES
ncbi:MAG: AAA family ATPase [Candidatus Aureabacteria bacterium]|nr:AAA family ATPase [Candidatus Auribacterota bacterium]